MCVVIPTPPELIFFEGILPAKRVPTVAIVGTRKPTNYDKEVAHQLGYDLAKRGVVIVSGLALGIDAIAHRAALEVNGTTLAVLTNSVDTIYIHPRNHDPDGNNRRHSRVRGKPVDDYLTLLTNM
jgi:DNA processing protein